MPIFAQLARQVCDLQIGLLKGLEGGELTPDMNIDPDDFDARQGGRLGIDLPGTGDGNPELVL